ncbi:hypothetical protein RBA41_31295 [Massilia sp. CCM 9210]|uniref:hypothetical protein n=1 Tax=Massilia scottii TaxID=3057166 RepID=UPI0027967976|nr:hypothetical protein [Massilia sp. CCM 9210]MDQ1817796.1 hypothetical protein [Massilia sp. CCM 9210]
MEKTDTFALQMSAALEAPNKFKRFKRRRKVFAMAITYLLLIGAAMMAPADVRWGIVAAVTVAFGLSYIDRNEPIYLDDNTLLKISAINFDSKDALDRFSSQLLMNGSVTLDDAEQLAESEKKARLLAGKRTGPGARAILTKGSSTLAASAELVALQSEHARIYSRIAELRALSTSP